jgi:hypothetical protein
MTLGNITSAEDFRQLAAQEATLAKVAVTNEGRAQHYAMAAYYTRLAEAKEKIAETMDVAIKDPSSAPFTNEPKQSHNSPMALRVREV